MVVRVIRVYVRHTEDGLVLTPRMPPTGWTVISLTWRNVFDDYERAK